MTCEDGIVAEADKLMSRRDLAAVGKVSGTDPSCRVFR
jgi:hypothetical protein